MSSQPWSKFFWSDWSSDPALRVCSLAAQGLWMRLLCVAAEHDPIGYVAINGRSLGVTDIARLAGVTETAAAELLEDLSRNGVFSRDRKGCIYSRRMIRDEKRRKLNVKNGKSGGNPSLSKQREIFARDIPPDKPPDKPQKPEAIFQKVEQQRLPPVPEAPRAPPLGSADALLEQAKDELGVSLASLRQNLDWINFPAKVCEWRRQGAIDADIWPTMKRLMAKKGELPRSPAYFAAAVIEAKDRRIAERAATQASAKAMADLPDDHPTQIGRLRHWRDTGEWFEDWGRRPQEALRA